MSSLQFHFLQTLEHRTDVSVTSTSLWGEAPEERGAPQVPASPPRCAGACSGEPQGPRAVPCGSLSRCQPRTGAGSCRWCPLREGVLGTTWSLEPPWCSPAPSPPLPACPGPIGVGNLWICGSETPAELHPGEGGPLLARLEQKG